MKFHQLEKYVEVDKDDLDNEIINLSNHLYYVGKMVGQLISRMDEAKTTLEFIQSDLTLQLQESIERGSSKRLSPSVIKHKVRATPAYRAALEQLQTLRRRHRRWMNLQKAFDRKGKNLATLTRLYMSEYYASGMTARSEENKRLLKEQARRKRTQ